MKTKAIQICGTGSGVGKSIITAAFCRIFLQDGYSVAPFKSQNMALNSFVTEEGAEIGRAQAIQAYAARIRPCVDINPILIKPTSDTKAQVILLGKPQGNMSVYEYKNYKGLVFDKVKRSFNNLKKRYEIIVIEGAGSPAEINLKKHDLVNLKIARLAQAGVILVGDIDRGGVFASLLGTLQLLSAKERKMVKGFIINKFRGDQRLLKPGIDFLEKRTGIKVLGVVPYFKDINIPEEDSLPQELKKESVNLKNKIKIDVIYLPHISNFTDFDALKQEPDVSLKYIARPDDLERPDIVIVPGTKNTIEDLNYLKRSGLSKKIVSIFQSCPQTMLVGICGGYQMLGERICDTKGIESKMKEMKGLGILPLMTRIYPEKILSQVKAKDLLSGIEVTGYQIHHGRSAAAAHLKPAFEILQTQDRKIKRYDGIISRDGRCWGTYIHGVFDSDIFRRHFLNNARRRKGWKQLRILSNYNIDKEIDKLAYLIRRSVNLDLVYKILKGGRHEGSFFVERW